MATSNGHAPDHTIEPMAECGVKRLERLIYGDENVNCDISKSLMNPVACDKGRSVDSSVDAVASFYDIRHSIKSLPPNSGTVILFYKYVEVPRELVEELLSWQKEICSELLLRGRIHVGIEGINGTAGGATLSCDLYIRAMRSHSRWSSFFAETDFKRSIGGRECFPNLFVRACTEIIMMNRDSERASWKNCAQHLSPEEFHRRLLERGDDDVLLDVRNAYESNIGTFRGAVQLPTRHFTDFPAIVDELITSHELKNKNVYMYCTGGIRCERASALLREKGVERCFQLRGGIHRYTETFSDHESLFQGKNFVFDRRMATPRVSDNVIVGKCVKCGSDWDEYSKEYSCSQCSALCLVCASCRPKRAGQRQKRKREQDGTLLCKLCSESAS